MLEIIELSSILVFLFFSFIYSGSEVALLSIPDHERHKLALDKSRKSRRILHAIRNPQRALITVLVGNMVVNIGASIVGHQLSETVFTSNQLFYSVFIMTFLVLLFGEIVPKNFASSKPVQFSRFFISVLETTYRIFYPLVLVLGKLASRVKEEGSAAVLSKDELATAVESGTAIGLDPYSVRLLKNLIRIIDTPITEIMVPRSDIIGVDINDYWIDMEKKFLDIPFSTVLFYEETIDNIVGYIPKLNLLDAHKKDLRERMIEPLFVPATKHILSLLGDFKVQNRYIAVVLDEFGGTSGLVTMKEILDTIFIKDILLKHYVEQKDRYTWVIRGTMKIQDLNDALQIDLPTEYSTISGFIINLTSGIPKPGTTLDIDDEYTLTILQSDEKQVESMEIRKRVH